MLGRNSGFVARSFARIFFCNDGLSCNCFCIGMLKMQGYYLCNIQVENVVVQCRLKTCSWAGLGDNAPHILWAIVSNILLVTTYFIIFF